MTRRMEVYLLLLLAGATTIGAYVRENYNGQVLARGRNINFIVGPDVKAGLKNASGKTVITAESDPVAAISAAMATWNSARGGNLNLTMVTSSTTQRAANDSRNIITFDDTPANRSIVGSALAVTHYYFIPSEGTIIDSDIIFNPDMTFATIPTLDAYDLQAIATHELGHSIGADHTPFSPAVMFPYSGSEDTSGRVLSNDDLGFVQDVYSSGGPMGGIRGSIKTASGEFPASALVLAVNRDGGVRAATYTSGGFYSNGGLAAGDYAVVAFPVSPYLAGDGSTDYETPDWQASFYGGATPQIVSVSAGTYAEADIVVPDGSAQVAIQFADFGNSFMGYGSRVSSGHGVPVTLYGSGFPANVRAEDITIYGSGATVRPDSIEASDSLLTFVMDVPARGDWIEPAIVVWANGLPAVFADIRIGPTQLTFSPSGVVNGATFEKGPVAPGELVSIFGDAMGPGQGVSATLDSGGRLPTSLSDTVVEIEGRAAPLLYVSSGQINAQVPFEVAGRASARVRVRHGGSSADVIVPVADASPGVFGTWSEPAILNEDGSLNSFDHPVARGRTVVVYATGQGLVDPLVATGQIAPASPLSRSTDVTAAIEGNQARIDFTGLAPGFVGLWQVNVVVPNEAPLGYDELVLTVKGSLSSEPVYLWVN